MVATRSLAESVVPVTALRLSQPLGPDVRDWLSTTNQAPRTRCPRCMARLDGARCGAVTIRAAAES